MGIKSSSDASFKKDVLESKGLFLVDFWADWCGPCRAVAPTLEDISYDMKDKVTVVKVNIDQNPDTPNEYGVRSIPTLMLFKDGKMVDTKVGAVSKSTLVAWIEQFA